VTKALRDNYNQPTALFACLRDEPLRKVLQNIAAREKFVDQQGIQDVCAQEALQESCTKYRYRPRQGEGLTRVYFSPEDNPTAEISRTLHLASLSGPDAFILISASLLTDRYLQKTLMQAKSKGVFLALVLDRFQYERLDAEDREFLQNLGARIFWVDPLFEAYEFVQNHHRFALVWNPHIGKTFVITGSANWSASGLTRNDEHTIISTDPALVESHAQEFLAQLLNFGAKGDENDQDFIGIVLRLRNALGQPIWLEAMAAPKPGRFLLALDKLTFADSFDYEWSLATLDESGTLQRQRFQKLTDERLLLGIDLGPAPLKKVIQRSNTSCRWTSSGQGLTRLFIVLFACRTLSLIEKNRRNIHADAVQNFIVVRLQRSSHRLVCSRPWSILSALDGSLDHLMPEPFPPRHLRGDARV
jgi:hypothetical protein